MQRVWRLLAVWCLMTGTASPALADTWRPLARWRIGDGRVAPWAAPGTPIDSSYRGRELRFETTKLVAAPPLACDGAKYEWRFVGPDDLFEGNLPVPRAQAARALGLAESSVPTLRISCTNAGFDFHRAGDGTWRLALDNVVWTLTPVTRATAPAEIVQELLVTHFTHDMGFSRESVALKRTFLSPGLRAGIEAYMAKPQSPDEAPEINGDPFTDSQEYPDRFTLGPLRTSAGRTVVPVHFADAHRTRRVDYVLVRDGGRWVVDDLIDERGGSLMRLRR